MTASALRPKTNTRRLLYFIGISLAIHVVMLVVFSLDYLFGEKPKPADEAAVAPAAVPAPAPAATPEKPAAAPAAAPAAPAKPKDADAEYQKRQTPASEDEKKKAENLRPDLDQLK